MPVSSFRFEHVLDLFFLEHRNPFVVYERVLLYFLQSGKRNKDNDLIRRSPETSMYISQYM